MIDGGEHLWNCLRYIDLNMVRAGVVQHPEGWAWCGYRELVGKRKRFRLLDVDRLTEILGVSDPSQLAAMHRQRIMEAIEQRRLSREGIWTESIAVGSEAFVKEIAAKNKKRKRLYTTLRADGACCLEEQELSTRGSWTRKRRPKIASKP
jgi:putative transposase